MEAMTALKVIARTLVAVLVCMFMVIIFRPSERHWARDVAIALMVAIVLLELIARRLIKRK